MSLCSRRGFFSALVGPCAVLTVVAAACGTDEGGAEAQTLSTDSGAGSGGEAGHGGAGARHGHDAAADTVEEPAEPCGKEFEPCCGGHAGFCEGSTALSCNDAACVTCTSVPAISPACSNVAASGTASASHTRLPDDAAASYAPALAIDRNVCNVWASGDYAVHPEAGVTDTWWQLDLGSERQITAVTLWLAMTPAGPVSLGVEHGSDGASWQTAWSGTQPMSGHSPWIHSLSKPITARFLRIRFLDSPSWISIREFAAFECPGS
jgi:hypothetical protein